MVQEPSFFLSLSLLSSLLYHITTVTSVGLQAEEEFWISHFASLFRLSHVIASIHSCPYVLSLLSHSVIATEVSYTFFPSSYIYMYC